MTYTVNTSQGSVAAVVNKLEKVIVAGLNLVGLGYVNYGEDIAENFVRIAENFRSDSPPYDALLGQLWLDTNTARSPIPILRACVKRPTGLDPSTHTTAYHADEWLALFSLDAANNRAGLIFNGTALYPDINANPNTLVVRDSDGKVGLSSIPAALLVPDNKGYIFLEEYRLPGDTNDNAALARAKPVQLATGLPIMLRPGKGSGTTLSDSIDGFTGAVIPDKFRAQQGDWLIDAWSQNGIVEGNVVTPNLDDEGNMWSNMHIVGVRGLTRIRRANPGKPYIFTCNPKNTTATTVNGEDTQSYVYKNIKLQGLVFTSNNGFYGNAEHDHQICLNAVENVLIQDCISYGHRADVIYIGAGQIGGGSQNRHNRNVIIRDCYIDGYNQNNRNPISVIDCDTLLVENVHTVNCAKFGATLTGLAQNGFNPNSGIPAPSSLIDVEPNGFTDNAVCRFITVNNCSARNGGGAGITWFFGFNAGAPGEPTPMQYFICSNSNFVNVKHGFATFGSYFGDGPLYHCRFVNNTVIKCREPITMICMDGIEIANNTFEDCDIAGYVGLETTRGQVYTGVRHMDMHGNKFRRNGFAAIGAFAITGCTNSRIRDNDFEDNSGCGFCFRGAGETSYLSITNNRWFNTTSPLSRNQSLSIAVYDFSNQPGDTGGTPQINNATCYMDKNEYNGAPVYLLKMRGAPVGVPPESAGFRVGDEYQGQVDAPGGEVRRWVCSDVGSANRTPRWEIIRQPGGEPDRVSTFDVLGSTTRSANIQVTNQTIRALFPAENFIKGTSFSGGTVRMKLQVGPRGGDGSMMGWTTSNLTVDQMISQNRAFVDFRFGVWIENGVLRPIQLGVIQAPPSIPLMRYNQYIELVYVNEAGQGTVFVTDPDTGVSTQVFQISNAATSSVTPFFRVNRPNQPFRWLGG
jgi:hypothetical protein